MGQKPGYQRGFFYQTGGYSEEFLLSVGLRPLDPTKVFTGPVEPCPIRYFPPKLVYATYPERER